MLVPSDSSLKMHTSSCRGCSHPSITVSHHAHHRKLLLLRPLKVHISPTSLSVPTDPNTLQHAHTICPPFHTHSTYPLTLKSPTTTHLDLTSTIPALPVPMHSTPMTCPVCFYPTTCSMPILSGKAARNPMVTMTPMLAPTCQRCFIGFFQREQWERGDPSVLTSFPPLLERDHYMKFQVRDQPLTLPFSHLSRAVGSIVALWGKSSRSY